MVDRDKLLEEFKKAMWDLYRKESAVLGKPDGSFFYLMERDGELGAAKLMLETDDHIDGFTRLQYAGHPELTVEYLVWHSPKDGYQSLFEAIHLNKAGQRLGEIS